MDTYVRSSSKVPLESNFSDFRYKQLHYFLPWSWNPRGKFTDFLTFGASPVDGHSSRNNEHHLVVDLNQNPSCTLHYTPPPRESRDMTFRIFDFNAYRLLSFRGLTGTGSTEYSVQTWPYSVSVASCCAARARLRSASQPVKRQQQHYRNEILKIPKINELTKVLPFWSPGLWAQRSRLSSSSTKCQC